jgi:hypothetical protein
VTKEYPYDMSESTSLKLHDCPRLEAATGGCRNRCIYR